MIYLGIDPGKSGGIAAINDEGTIIRTVKLDETGADIAQFLRQHSHSYDGRFSMVWLEKVHSMPSQGVKSVFTFGESFGWCKGALDVIGLRYELVTPQKWQKAMDCMTGGDKKVSRAAAQRLWPLHTITDAIADALLIAEYGRRLEVRQ